MISSNKKILIDVLSNDENVQGVPGLKLQIVTEPKYGYISITPDNKIEYEHKVETGAGKDSFTYTVIYDSITNIDIEPATVNIDITGINKKPIVVNDNVTVEPGQSIWIKPMLNDTAGDDFYLKIDVPPSMGTLEEVDKDRLIYKCSDNPSLKTDKIVYWLANDKDIVVSDLASIDIVIKDFVPEAVDDVFNMKKSQEKLIMDLFENDKHITDGCTLDIDRDATFGHVQIINDVLGTAEYLVYPDIPDDIKTDSFTYMIDYKSTEFGPATVTINFDPDPILQDDTTTVKYDDTDSIDKKIEKAMSDGVAFANDDEYFTDGAEVLSNINIKENDMFPTGDNRDDWKTIIVEEPEFGRLNVVKEGQYEYLYSKFLPFDGFDTFEYLLQKGSKRSNVATVKIILLAIYVEDYNFTCIRNKDIDKDLFEPGLHLHRPIHFPDDKAPREFELVITEKPKYGTITVDPHRAPDRLDFSYLNTNPNAFSDSFKYKVESKNYTDELVSNESVVTINLINEKVFELLLDKQPQKIPIYNEMGGKISIESDVYYGKVEVSSDKTEMLYTAAEDDEEGEEIINYIFESSNGEKSEMNTAIIHLCKPINISPSKLEEQQTVIRGKSYSFYLLDVVKGEYWKFVIDKKPNNGILDININTGIVTYQHNGSTVNRFDSFEYHYETKLKTFKTKVIRHRIEIRRPSETNVKEEHDIHDIDEDTSIIKDEN